MNRYRNMRRMVTVRRFGDSIASFLSLSVSFLINLIHYQGRAGYVDFNPISGDHKRPINGYLIVRKDGDGLHRTKIHFHCSNLWLSRDGQFPSRRFLHDILSQALLAGHNSSYIVWGDTALLPYDLRGIEQGFALVNSSYAELLTLRQKAVEQHQREMRLSIGEPEFPIQRERLFERTVMVRDTLLA